MIRHANFQLFRVHPDGLTPLRNGFLITFEKMQKQPPEVFYKKAILENFAILTGKHLCWSFFLILNIAVSKSTYFQNIHERLLLKMCSWKEKTLHKKKDFSTSISETSENVYVWLFHGWFPLKFGWIYMQCFFLIWWKNVY